MQIMPDAGGYDAVASQKENKTNQKNTGEDRSYTADSKNKNF